MGWFLFFLALGVWNIQRQLRRMERAQREAEVDRRLDEQRKLYGID